MEDLTRQDQGGVQKSDRIITISSTEIQKYSELFDINEKPNEKTIPEKIALTAGALNVAASMAPQSGLGALACDKLVKNNFTPVLRFSSDIAVGASSGAGKYAIVFYYGIAGYVALGSLDGWATLGGKLFSPRSLALFALSIPSALTFPYLNKISLVQSGKLLNELKLREVARVINSVPSQVTCMVTSGVGNLMAFPYIIDGGYYNIKKAIYFVVENPDYRNMIDTISGDLEKVRNCYKSLVENGELEKADKFLSSIIDIKNLSYDSNERESQLSKIRSAELKKLPTMSASPNIDEETCKMISKKILKAVLLNSKIPLGLMFVGVSIWGLSNFYYIGKQGLYFYLDASIPLTHEHFHEDKAFAHGEFHPILNNKGMEYCANVTAEASWLLSAYAVDVLASIWSGIVSGSLFAMALPSYFIPGNFIDWCYDRRNALAPYSKAITYSAAILAIFAGIIGGAPNLYQSFYTGQNVATNIASVISSNNIELPALYVILLGAIRLLSRIIGGIKNSCVTQSEEAKMAEFQIKLFEMADEILREANSLENLSAEQKQTLYKEYQSIQAGKNIVKNENATITDIGSAGRDAENDLRVSGSFSDEDDRCKASDVRSELVVISEENELPPQYWLPIVAKWAWGKTTSVSSCVKSSSCFWSESEIIDESSPLQLQDDLENNRGFGCTIS